MRCSFCEKEIPEELSFKNIFFKKERFILCDECKGFLNINTERISGYTLYYFADYEFLKESIYKIKYFGDIAEANRYKNLFDEFFSFYKFDEIIIVPANKIRKYIRGFDHIEQLCQQCEIEYRKILRTTYRPKQSKLHTKRHEHNFHINNIEKRRQDIKNILIIDDIFTSGKTLLSSAEALKNIYPNENISFLVLAKSREKK